MTVGLEGGSSSIFGYSGRSFDDWMKPGQRGELTKQIFVGPNSPNPNQQVFNDDWNNFGPAVGFAWQLPWFGKGKTTLRRGYQISYTPLGRADFVVGVVANTIGTTYVNSYTGDINYSNYHAMQAQVTLRPTAGFSFVTTYTWSRNMGLAAAGFGGAYTDPMSRAADYGLLSGHRSHQPVAYGTFDLPIGRNRPLLRDTNRVLDGFVGGWQLSWVYNYATGSPNTVVGNTTLWANGTVDFVGPEGSFDPKAGRVTWEDHAPDGNYFNNYYVKVRDPQCDMVTAEQGLNVQCNLQALALASDPSVIVFQNAMPGTRGNFGRFNISNLGRWTLDASLSKQFRIMEGKSISFRVDAQNVFNHPTPSLGAGLVSSRIFIPNNPDFGLTGTTARNKTGSRKTGSFLIAEGTIDEDLIIVLLFPSMGCLAALKIASFPNVLAARRL